MRYKYPIGTRIKYKGSAKQDVGKEGKIVGWETDSIVRIVIPDSFVALDCYGDPLHCWTTYITDVEILARKNEQLLFEFMNE